MIYFTIANTECGTLIDSVSSDYNALKNKFPQDKIYKSDDSIVSIYVLKENLHEVES